MKLPRRRVVTFVVATVVVLYVKSVLQPEQNKENEASARHAKHTDHDEEENKHYEPELYTQYLQSRLTTELLRSSDIASKPWRLPLCEWNYKNAEECPVHDEMFDRSFKVSYSLYSFEKLNKRHEDDLSEGGHFRPRTCHPDQKTAIIIPYKDRDKHLRILLNNLHPFLKSQGIDYTIFVVEQLPGSKFNRGMIKNIGYVEALKICDYNCFFFHDVDMVPDNYGNTYRCGDMPKHHTRDLARWNHRPPYSMSFGGVVSMTRGQFRKVNGYTNIYFEWGLEDDEMGLRIHAHGMKLTHKPFDVGSYRELNHTKSKQYKRSWHWSRQWRSRMKKDGLNSLVYKVEKIDFKPLYTHIFVNIDVDDVAKAYNGSIMLAKPSETNV